MASKLRNAREAQKSYWEAQLSKRIEVLKGAGHDDVRIKKDPAVRKLKAKLRESAFRINTIGAFEKKLEDMARLREEKKAAPPKEKGKKAAPVVVEEPKKKKKKKEEGGEEQAAKKESKKKAEKTEAAAS